MVDREGDIDCPIFSKVFKDAWHCLPNVGSCDELGIALNGVNGFNDLSDFIVVLFGCEIGKD
jgi:hypothetical protein